jgi:hypothetical protein
MQTKKGKEKEEKSAQRQGRGHEAVGKAKTEVQ